MKISLRKSSRYFLIALGAVIAVFLVSAFVYLKPRYTVPILMYHSVTLSPDRNNLLEVSASAFQRQMQFLKKHNYRVIRLKELAKLFSEKQAIPHRTVVITFDDGYRDNLDVAFPILKKYQLPATIFVSPLHIAGESKYLIWSELKKLADSGLIDIGSHTLKHVFLLDVKEDEGELYRQIRNSKEMLEYRLGRTIDLFSYPAGGFNQKIRQLVIDSGYVAAVASKPGLKYPNNDIFALKRMRISKNDENLFNFWVKLTGYYGPIREWQRRNKDKDISYE